jgi:hypothetical protein
MVGLAAAAYLLLEYLQPGWNVEAFHSKTVQGLCIGAGLLAMLLEKQIVWHARRLFGRAGLDAETVRKPASTETPVAGKSLFQIALAREQRTLGVVYMSGDELSARNLTPELLMTRWNILRGHLGSSGTELAGRMAGDLDEASLRQGFEELSRLEQENKGYAKENLDIQQARFRLGVASSLEIREAENSYVSTLARLNAAAYQVKLNETKVLEIEARLAE